jgi:large subunit ribosomal protein L39e
MGSRKTRTLKKLLLSAKRSNKRVPVWVMVRTNRAVSSNPKQRYWRFRKLTGKLKRRLKTAGED